MWLVRNEDYKNHDIAVIFIFGDSSSQNVSMSPIQYTKDLNQSCPSILGPILRIMHILTALSI